jgi:hypothetical protein
MEHDVFVQPVTNRAGGLTGISGVLTVLDESAKRP